MSIEIFKNIYNGIYIFIFINAFVNGGNTVNTLKHTIYKIYLNCVLILCSYCF